MRVLFVATTFPIPPHAGAKVALLETLRSIEALCELHLLVPRTDANSESDISVLRQIIPHTRLHCYQPHNDQPATLEKYTTAARCAFSGRSYHAAIWMDRNLREAACRLTEAHHFDIVHCEWLYPAIALQGLDLPLVIRTLDLHFVIMKNGVEELPSGKGLRKALWRMEAERFRRFEVGIFNTAQVTITVSTEDETVLRRQGVSNLVVLPPPMGIPQQSPFAREQEDVCTALFLCSLHIAINREASFVFTDEVWPRVNEQIRSRVNVIFAGGRPDQAARERAAECGIRVHAPLSDEEARQLYDKCDIFLSPVKTGTGIKTKVLEAMANGKPIIGFRNSFRGVPVENGKHALIADSDEDFALLFEKLVTDAPLRQRLGEAARSFVEEHFNPQNLGSQLVGIYAAAAEAAQRKVGAA